MVVGNKLALAARHPVKGLAVVVGACTRAAAAGRALVYAGCRTGRTLRAPVHMMNANRLAKGRQLHMAAAGRTSHPRQQQRLLLVPTAAQLQAGEAQILPAPTMRAGSGRQLIRW